MKHIDHNTTPGDVIMSGGEWILQGNARVRPFKLGGKVDMVKLTSYDQDIAWYNPMNLSITISMGAFNFSLTTTKHVYTFLRWCMQCGVMQVYHNGVNKNLKKFCNENRISLLIP